MNIESAMSKTDNGFYSPMHLIDYGRMANIITGHRSGGKSTGVSRFVLFDYILNGNKFIYIRRTRDELLLTRTKFFDNAINIINAANLGFKIVYFDCVAGRYKMTVDYDNQDYTPEKYDKDGNKIDLTEEEAAEERARDIKERAEDIGGTVALTESQKVKSGYDFKGVCSIIFDEFIAEHKTQYLGSYENPDVEYQNIISLLFSCDRGVGQYFRNETRLFLIGNNESSFYNPILMKWKVNRYMDMSPDAHFIAPKEQEWVMEIVPPSEKFKEEARKSKLVKLLDEKERDYNIGNKARTGTEGNEFVGSMPGYAKFRSNVILGGIIYSVWEDYNDFMYIRKGKKNKKADAFDIVKVYKDDCDKIVTNWKDSPIMNAIYLRFCRGKLLFYNQDSARAFLQYLRFIPR